MELRYFKQGKVYRAEWEKGSMSIEHGGQSFDPVEFLGMMSRGVYIESSPVTLINGKKGHENLSAEEEKRFLKALMQN